jgi:hypothetical protein
MLPTLGCGPGRRRWSWWWSRPGIRLCLGRRIVVLQNREGRIDIFEFFIRLCNEACVALVTIWVPNFDQIAIGLFDLLKSGVWP